MAPCSKVDALQDEFERMLREIVPSPAPTPIVPVDVGSKCWTHNLNKVMPVPPGTFVDIRYEGGKEFFSKRASTGMSWDRIVAYRICKKPVPPSSANLQGINA